MSMIAGRTLSRTIQHGGCCRHRQAWASLSYVGQQRPPLFRMNEIQPPFSRESRMLSSSLSKGIFGRIQETFENRTKKSRMEAYTKQLERMAKSETWTLSDYSSEIDSTLSSWRTKIPGLRNLPQVESARETQTVVKAAMDVLGKDVTFDDLRNLGRKDKLKISLKSGKSVEEVNLMLNQFEAVDVMHTVLRRRYELGKPLPVDENGMRAAIVSDGRTALSSKQKKSIRERQMKSMSGTQRKR